MGNNVNQAVSEMNITNISQPIYEAKFWLKLMGIFSILNGALMALSVFGIIIAWLPIWLGVVSLKAAKASEVAHLQADAVALLETNQRLKTAITIMGVIQLLMLITFIGSIVAVLGLGVGAAIMGSGLN